MRRITSNDSIEILGVIGVVVAITVKWDWTWALLAVSMLVLAVGLLSRILRGQ